MSVAGFFKLSSNANLEKYSYPYSQATLISTSETKNIKVLVH